MRFHWKPRRSETAEDAPQGVRIVCPDGREVACDVLRDPEQDRDGLAVWLAVPREPVPELSSFDDRFGVKADMMPGRSELVVSLPLGPGFTP